MIPQPTELQQCFAVEYALNGGNATKAALVVGYSERSASDLGRRTINLLLVQVAINRELMKLRYRSGAVGLNAMIQIATATHALTSNEGSQLKQTRLLHDPVYANDPKPTSSTNKLSIANGLHSIGTIQQVSTLRIRHQLKLRRVRLRKANA